MRIDHLINPLGIVKRYKIPYGEGLYLEGRVMGSSEEGISEVTWFEGDIRYARNNREIGGTQFDGFYQAFKRGAATIGAVEKMLRKWCSSMGLRISEVITESEGVIV